MAKYVDAEKLIKAGKKAAESTNDFAAKMAMETMEKLINLMPPAEVVSLGVVKQIQWERDVAIEQLNSYGVGFAEKADVVRVKHGKWYRHDKKIHGDTCYHCSECERMPLTDCGMVWELTPYCPFCGAKMDGEHNDR